MEQADYSSSFNEFIYDRIPESVTVLDVGCWNGNLGSALINNKNCIVDGIDSNRDILQRAHERGYRSTFNMDLNNPESSTTINGYYDCIIFGDVLEHLINPDNVLRNFKDKVSRNGFIITSLPNVAFLLNRLNLLFGNWNYRDFGILDRTHLRFFTMDSGKKLLEENGYQVLKVIPYNQFGFLRKIDYLTALFPTLLAYQVLYIAKPK